MKSGQDINIPLTDDWDCVITIPPCKLIDTLTRGASTKSANDFELSANEDGVYVSSEPGFGKSTKRFQEPDDIAMTANRPMAATLYRSQTVCEILNAISSLSEMVTLSGTSQGPIKLSHPIFETKEEDEKECLGQMLYYVAPCLEEGDDGVFVVDNDIHFVFPSAFSRARHAEFEARLTTKGRSLFPFIQALHNRAYGVSMSVDDSGMRIHGMDQSDASMVDITIPSSVFESFHCKEETWINLDIFDLYSALVNTCTMDVFTLTVALRDCFQMRFEGLEPGVVTVNGKFPTNALDVEIYTPCQPTPTVALCVEITLLDTPPEQLHVPAIQYSHIMPMPSALFDSIINTLKGNECLIGANQEGIVFCADSSSLSVLDGKLGEVLPDTDEPVEVLFDLQHLKSFPRVAGLASTVTL